MALRRTITGTVPVWINGWWSSALGVLSGVCELKFDDADLYNSAGLGAGPVRSSPTRMATR
jgi:hypothetical protein